VVYRMGLLGVLPLLAIVGVALVRVGRRLHEQPAREERSRLVGLTAVFAFAVVVASFNVALEGPYMSMFFWTILGLLLIAQNAERAKAARAPAEAASLPTRGRPQSDA